MAVGDRCTGQIRQPAGERHVLLGGGVLAAGLQPSVRLHAAATSVRRWSGALDGVARVTAG